MNDSRFGYISSQFNNYVFLIKGEKTDAPIILSMDLGIKTIDDYDRFRVFVDYIRYKRSATFKWADDSNYMDYNEKTARFDIRNRGVVYEIEMLDEPAYSHILTQMEHLRFAIESWFDAFVV